MVGKKIIFKTYSQAKTHRETAEEAIGPLYLASFGSILHVTSSKVSRVKNIYCLWNHCMWWDRAEWHWHKRNAIRFRPAQIKLSDWKCFPTSNTENTYKVMNAPRDTLRYRMKFMFCSEKIKTLTKHAVCWLSRIKHRCKPQLSKPNKANRLMFYLFIYSNPCKAKSTFTMLW